jgi:hypothetical protein
MYYNNYQPDPLFTSYYLDGYLREKGDSLRSHIKNLGIKEFEKESLLSELLERYKMTPVIVKEDEKKIDAIEADVTVRSQFFDDDDDRRVFTTKGLSITVKIPFVGDRNLFACRPSTHTFSGTPRADVEQNQIILKYETTEKDPEKIKQLWLRDISEIQKNVDWINNDLNGYNSRLETEINNLLSERKKQAGENQSLLNAILN